MVWKETEKKMAVFRALEHVKDGMVLGLGTGSTVDYAIREVGRRIKEENLHVLGIPSSFKTSLLAVECGIPLTTLDKNPTLDLDIDGADQVDKHLNLVKGKGGALTREKIVASASKEFIIVVDETKITDILGRDHLLPIEVLPFSFPFVKLKIESFGGTPFLRRNRDDSGSYITDNGNFILDVDFDVIDKPIELNLRLKSIPGVVETGLFLGMVDIVYAGIGKEVTVMKRVK